MLLAQQDDQPLFDFTVAPLFEDSGIPLAVMGIFVVFMALVMVATFIFILPRVLDSSSLDQREEATPAAIAGEDELSKETLVVIAAAVTHALGKPHRVVRIRGLTPADQGWSLEGRTQHHRSHQFKRRAGQ